VLLNCVDNVLGPLRTLHVPVPIAGVFAVKIADPVVQIVCGLPATDGVGGASTVMVTFDVEGLHGALLIVQVNT
jgi:hypothetical protein